MALRLLGGGSSLTAVVSDMNANILELMQLQGASRVVSGGTTTITTALSSTDTIAIPHGLGYTPQADVWVVNVAGTNFKRLPCTFSSLLLPDEAFDYDVDATYLNITAELNSSSLQVGDVVFYYQFYNRPVN